MGTKNDPGRYDCYANAESDEPMFVLLGRDDRAPALVEAWADASERRGTSPEKVAEARKCAADMREWRRKTLVVDLDDPGLQVHLPTDGQVGFDGSAEPEGE